MGPEEWKELAIMIASGAVGTLAFAVIFSVKPKHLIFATLGGIIACILYFFTKNIGLFAANAISSFAVTMYSELISRLRKAPVVTFLTPAVITLVPGGSLYRCVASMIAKNYKEAGGYALDTLNVCLGIAAGIMVASLCVSCFFLIKKKIISRREAKG